MSQYEVIIACVAITNLVLTLGTLYAARQRATTSRLDSLEDAIDARLDVMSDELHRLKARDSVAVTHDHLAEVYRDLKSLSQQVHTLLGEQRAINDNLRLLIARELKF